MDRRVLEKLASAFLKPHKELNEKYPERENKRGTLIVDFQYLENEAGAGIIKSQPFNRLERDIYQSMSKDDTGTLIFRIDLDIASRNLTIRQREVIKWTLEGCTQKEIGERMSIARKNVQKHFGLIKKKLLQLATNN